MDVQERRYLQGWEAAVVSESALASTPAVSEILGEHSEQSFSCLLGHSIRYKLKDMFSLQTIPFLIIWLVCVVKSKSGNECKNIS